MFTSKSSIFLLCLLISVGEFLLLISLVILQETLNMILALLWCSTNALPLDLDDDDAAYWLQFSRRASLRPFLVRQRAFHDKRASLRPGGGRFGGVSSHLPQYYAYSLG